MQVAGGLIRFGLTEVLTPPFNLLAPTRFEIEGDFRYYLPSPFYGRPLAQYFGPPLPPSSTGPPSAFTAIYGSRPVDLVLATAWEQQLSLWRDDKRPDWVDEVTAEVARLTCLIYGLGSLSPYRLTNGSEWIFFPDADKRTRFSALPEGFQLGADLVYRHLAFGIAAYQSRLRELGVPISKKIFIHELLPGVHASG